MTEQKNHHFRDETQTHCWTMLDCCYGWCIVLFNNIFNMRDIVSFRVDVTFIFFFFDFSFQSFHISEPIVIKFIVMKIKHTFWLLYYFMFAFYVCVCDLVTASVIPTLHIKVVIHCLMIYIVEFTCEQIKKGHQIKKKNSTTCISNRANRWANRQEPWCDHTAFGYRHSMWNKSMQTMHSIIKTDFRMGNLSTRNRRKFNELKPSENK